MTTTTTTPAPITDEQAALIGNRWQGRNGAVRYYINDWADLVGLSVDFYNTGNVAYASYNGEKLANGRASRLLCGRLWIENGGVYSTIDWAAGRVEKPALRALVVAEIARLQSA